jgi:hypothetical protein
MKDVVDKKIQKSQGGKPNANAKRSVIAAILEKPGRKVPKRPDVGAVRG